MPLVASAERTLNLFEAFEASGKPLALSELAQRMNVPVSSCHGLVQTLVARGYLDAVSRRKDFYPTRRLFDLAQTDVHNPSSSGSVPNCGSCATKRAKR